MTKKPRDEEEDMKFLRPFRKGEASVHLEYPSRRRYFRSLVFGRGSLSSSWLSYIRGVKAERVEVTGSRCKIVSGRALVAVLYHGVGGGGRQVTPGVVHT